MNRALIFAALGAAILSAVLYAAFWPGANPEPVARVDRDELMALRTGEMRKLIIHATPEKLPVFSLLDMQDGEHSLDEYHGKYVVLNFWATWCAPCRKEMPSLEALQNDLGSDQFEVVIIAAGRNPKPAIDKFFKDAEIKTLKTLRDPTQQLVNMMGVFGLPVTVILNPEGLEIARMRGDADWHSQDAVDFLRGMIAGKAS